MDEIIENLGISSDKLLNIRELTDDELSERFTVEELIKISEALGYEFEDLFIKEWE